MRRYSWPPPLTDHRLDGAPEVGKPALSLGERVVRDGAFISRSGTGEGLLPFPSPAVRLEFRIRYRFPPPVWSASCGAPKYKLKARPGACCTAEGPRQSFGARLPWDTGLLVTTALHTEGRSSLLVISAEPDAERHCGRELLR